ncbi:sensor histidine kinase [Marinicella sp. W31]|uniref:sensor histidine kinase n=1 Tax=Marinicella sp. W31 TaxID=3023713 RepID=UPI0037563D07
MPFFIQFNQFNQETLLYFLVHVTFGLFYWMITNNIGRLDYNIRIWASLLIMTVVIFAINYITMSAIGIFYALIVSVLLPWLLTVKACISVLSIIILLLGIQFHALIGFSEDVLIQYVLFFAFVGLLAFSYIISLIAYRQQNAKEELRLLNTELRATQVLLADSSRINERLRISRELHDLIGHHLTALTLNLEAASHITEGKPKQYVKKSQSIARLLLGDVREVVSKFRQTGTLDLGQAVRELLAGIPSPKIHQQIPDVFLLEDPKLAQTILRCAQELITNTMKHAQAKQMWLRLERTGKAIILIVRDDGIGLKNVHEGNGLTGIRERVKQCSGEVEFESSEGLTVRLSFPA